MEVTRRKYEKKSTEGKITVKHYLNTKLKPVYHWGKDEKDRFPIYITIGVVRQSLQIKSKILIPVAIDEFDSFVFDNKVFIDNEVRRITEIIKRQDPFKSRNFDIKMVNFVYNNSTTRLDEVIESRLKIEIQKLLLTNLDKELINTKYDILNEKLFKKYSQNSEYQKINIRFFSSTDWKNLSAKALIEIFADYERTFEIDSLKGFKDLLNKYWVLWNFVSEYKSSFANCFNVIEPTAIDWFENDFIQNTLRKIYKDEPNMADDYINQTNDLLTVNPNISWYVAE